MTAMTVTVPRRHALKVALLLVMEYLRAVRYGSESVTFFIGEDER